MNYVSSPYSPQKGEPDYIADVRYTQVMKFVSENFGGEGYWLFSPILHCHEMARRYDIPTLFNFWQEYDQHMLDIADELWILMLPAWESSKGVRAEAGYMATTLGKPVRFFLMDGSEEHAASDTVLGDWLFEVMQDRAREVAKGK